MFVQDQQPRQQKQTNGATGQVPPPLPETVELPDEQQQVDVGIDSQVTTPLKEEVAVQKQQ